jgi:hypothetical protein
MLTQPKFSHPSSLVERLFARFTAIYGTQKYSSMWAGLVVPNPRRSEEQEREAWAKAMQGVQNVWAEALSEFHVDVISAAVRDLALSDQMWPPSLPEFVGMCREQEERIKPAPLLQLPNDASLADPDSPVVQEALAELRRFTAAKRMPS